MARGRFGGIETGNQRGVNAEVGTKPEHFFCEKGRGLGIFPRLNWRRRADSNRCIEVLQTSPLTTWVRRLAPLANTNLLRLATMS